MNVRFNIPQFSKRDCILCRRLFLHADPLEALPKTTLPHLIGWSYLLDLLTVHWVVIDGGLFMTTAGNELAKGNVHLYPKLIDNEGALNHVHLESIAERKPLQFYFAAKVIENWSRLIPCETDIKRDVTFYVTQDKNFELCVYGPQSRSSLADLDSRFSSRPLINAEVGEFTSWAFQGKGIRGVPPICEIFDGKENERR